MRRVRPERAFTVLISVLVLGLVLVGSIEASGRVPRWSVADELVIGFHGGVTMTDAEDVYRGHGASQLKHLDGINVHHVRVNHGTLAAVEQALRNDPRVKFVEPNYLFAPNLITDDPLVGDQWHLATIGASAAWDVTMGSPEIVIAILDSGIDSAHPDLATKLVPGFNAYSNNLDTRDVYGHGTRVAGAAAATGGNAIGIASPALLNRVMPIRVTGTDGWATSAALASGLVWAVDHGARVMNMSFGSVVGNGAIESAAKYVVDRGGVVVAAAGNCGCVDSAADSPYIISVAATDSSDIVAGWSSRGHYVDVAAPGVAILTTVNGGGYGAVSGTSFASPITAGVIGLLLAVNPALRALDVESILASTAQDLNGDGWDPEYGHGRVDAAAAVSFAATSTPVPDRTPPTVTVTSPTTGSTVSGSVAVSASAMDDRGVERVDFFVDGVFVGRDTAPPFAFVWNTATAGNGTRVLAAVAVDAANNATTSQPVSVIVDDGGSGGTPFVTITSAGFHGRWLKVKVSATDDGPISTVDLYLDGQKIQTDRTAPFEFSIDARKLASGSHSLQARAYDSAGNLGVSTAVTIIK